MGPAKKKLRARGRPYAVALVGWISLAAFACAPAFKDPLPLDVFLVLRLAEQSAAASSPTSTPSSTPASTPAATQAFRYVFLTPTATNGDLKTAGGAATGIQGADALCAAAKTASFGSLTGAAADYKAMVVDGTARIACTTANCSGGTAEHTDWVLEPSTEYRRSDGTIVGTTTSAGIFSAPLTNAFHAGNTWWTGFNPNYTDPGNAEQCADWAATGGSGIFGSGAQTTTAAWANGVGAGGLTGDPCAFTKRLLCVQTRAP